MIHCILAATNKPFAANIHQDVPRDDHLTANCHSSRDASRTSISTPTSRSCVKVKQTDQTSVDLETEGLPTSSHTGKMAVAEESPSGTSITDDDRKAVNAVVPIAECDGAQNENGTHDKPKEGEDGSLKSYFVSDASSPRHHI